MPEQERKRRNSKKKESKETEAKANPEVTKKGKSLKEDMDALLDEIDEVLEENAEEFIKNYVQRGGQ